ncbi:MAG: tetratricopeptide repeat protein, partial [Deltaproteobacteria bacterium]|nr:tetratricopeptide repeat protein [Deltaproteobacteria bacterium]
DKAIKEYQAVLALDQNNLKALLMAGALSELKGDDATALEFFTLAAKTQDPRGYMALAQYYLRSKQFEAVHKTLDEGLEKHSNNPAILELKGRLLAEQGRTAEAVPFLQSLEEVKPGRGIPLLIVAFLKNDQVENAVAVAKKVITRNPKSAYGYVLLSSIYEQQKDYDQAEKVILDGIGKTGDKNPGLKMRLGMLYEKIDKTDLAMQTYQDIAEQYPKFYNATFAIGALNDRLGNKREALKLYEEVLAKDAKHLLSLNNAAYLYAENYSDKEKALELAMKAYRLRPSNPGVMDTLGYVLLQNDRGQEALKLLGKAARQLSKNPTVLYHLALACNNQNLNTQAITILE